MGAKTEKSILDVSWPIPAIDVIRGLAALGVAIAHFGQQEVELKSYGPLGMFMYQLGTWGVTIFFILSGFCIHGASLAAAKKGHVIRWSFFFKRRFLRIYPAFLLSIVVAGMASTLYSTELLKTASFSAALKHIFLVSNFDAADRCSLNGVLWSVVMECHFYLLYPVYIWLIRVVGDTKAFWMIFFLGWIYFLSVSLLTGPGDLRVALQFTFPGLWWKWCLGAFLAKVYFDGAFRFKGILGRKWVTPALCVISFLTAFVSSGAYVLWFQRILLPFILAAFLLSVAYQGKLYLDIKYLRWVGIASYSIYLFHPVTLAPFSEYTTGFWPADLMIFLILSILVGALGYMFIEKPFMRSNRRS